MYYKNDYYTRKTKKHSKQQQQQARNTNNTEGTREWSEDKTREMTAGRNGFG